MLSTIFWACLAALWVLCSIIFFVAMLCSEYNEKGHMRSLALSSHFLMSLFGPIWFGILISDYTEDNDKKKRNK